MLKTYLYIPEEFDLQIKRLAKIKKTSKANIIRATIEKGLHEFHAEKNSGVEILLKLAEIGEKNKLKGPKDLSTNHDKYLWDDYEL